MVKIIRKVPLIWWLAIGFEVYFLFIAFFLYEVVSGWDTLVRYAPMAEAFAAGDFRVAFHPRFCLLFQVLSGIVVWVTGASGIAACQFVAITFWVASGVVLWYLTRRLFDERAAGWSVLLLFASSEFFEYGCEGYRDDVRILPTLMICLAFVRLLFSRESENRWWGSWMMATGVFLLALLRVDCLPVCVFALVAYGAICLRRKLLVLTLPPAGLLLMAMFMLCYMVYAYTGYFLPAPHYIRLFFGGAL